MQGREGFDAEALADARQIATLEWLRDAAATVTLPLGATAADIGAICARRLERLGGGGGGPSGPGTRAWPTQTPAYPP